MNSIRPSVRYCSCHALVLGALLLCASPIPAADLDALVTAGDAIAVDGYQINSGGADTMSYSISGAGDMNGDGLADVVIGAVSANTPTIGVTGRAYVLYGSPSPTTISASELLKGNGGFAFHATNANSRTSKVVSGAGDFNGDGYDDAIVCAPSFGSYSTPGRAYIVYGGEENTGVSTTDLLMGVGGFTLYPQSSLRGERGAVISSFCRRASGAGDFNGDGLDDVMINVDRQSYGGFDDVLVIFGRTSGTSLNVSSIAPGTQGVIIRGSHTDSLGDSLSGAGDVNGDGFDDVIISVPRVQISGAPRGRALVVFGGTGLSTIMASDVVNGTGGFAINPHDNNAYDGMSVSGVGDVNADGLADVVVGVKGSFPAGGPSRPGVCYVVFGKNTTTAVEGSAIVAGTGGFAIVGEIDGDGLGTGPATTAVSGVGDVNRDGRADLLVSSRSHRSGAGYDLGAAYLVMGKVSGTPVQLSSLRASSPQFVFDGDSDYDLVGNSVNAAGDINGDGIPDLAIGTGYQFSGTDRGYVVFGDGTAPASATYRRYMPAGTTTSVPIGDTGDGSQFPPDSHAWVKHNGGTGPSLLTVQYFQSSSALTNVPGTPLNSYWSISTPRTGTTDTELRLHYTDAQLGSASENSLRLYRSQNIAGPWTEVAGAVPIPARNEVRATTASGRYFVITADSTGASATITAVAPAAPDDDYRTFNVTFTESVGTTFNSLDVSATGSMAATSNVAVHQITDSNYEVVVSLDDPDANGTIGISLIAPGIYDLFGNTLAGSTGGTPVTVTNYPAGDVTQDGVLDLADVALLADANLGLVTLP